MWIVVTIAINVSNAVWTWYLQNIRITGKAIAQLLPAFNEGTKVVNKRFPENIPYLLFMFGSESQ